MEVADLVAAGEAGEGYGVCWSSLQGQRGVERRKDRMKREDGGTSSTLDDANGASLYTPPPSSPVDVTPCVNAAPTGQPGYYRSECRR